MPRNHCVEQSLILSKLRQPTSLLHHPCTILITHLYSALACGTCTVLIPAVWPGQATQAPMAAAQCNAESIRADVDLRTAVMCYTAESANARFTARSAVLMCTCAGRGCTRCEPGGRQPQRHPGRLRVRRDCGLLQPPRVAPARRAHGGAAGHELEGLPSGGAHAGTPQPILW